MVLWQHPSNGTAAAFHDCLPDSDKLVDLMEDTTQTAWYFPLSNVHWKHMEGQQTALKTQQSQHVQTEIHSLPASQISLLKKRGFLSQGGKWNEINIFPSAFSLVLFLLFHVIHAAVTRLFTQPIGDIYESSLMSSFGKSKYLWYNILSRKPLPNSIIGWKEDVKCPGHCCQTKWCLNNALWQETERNSVFWWLI